MPTQYIKGDEEGGSLLPASSRYRVFHYPPQRAFPARNAHPVDVRFAIENGCQTVR